MHVLLESWIQQTENSLVGVVWQLEKHAVTVPLENLRKNMACLLELSAMTMGVIHALIKELGL